MSWLTIASLPLRRMPEEGAILVVFKPWLEQEAQLGELTSTGLYPTRRLNPFTWLAFAEPGWNGRELQQNAALLVTGSRNFSLCASRTEPVRKLAKGSDR
jgi:hypothetical protein